MVQVKTRDLQDDVLISAKEARRLLGDVSDMFFFRRLRDDPSFPTPIKYTARGRRYWRKGELLAWVESHRVGAGPDIAA